MVNGLVNLFSKTKIDLKTVVVNLLSGWYNIEAANGILVHINWASIGALNDDNVTAESLCVTVASKCTDLRRTTCQKKKEKKDSL